MMWIWELFKGFFSPLQYMGIKIY